MNKNLKEYQMTFYQWMNLEYCIVKKQYKDLKDYQKDRLKEEYNKYLQDDINC